MAKAVVFDLWSTLAYNDYSRFRVKPKNGFMYMIAEKAGVKDDSWDVHRRMEESFMLKKYRNVEEGMKDFCRHFGKDEGKAKELAKPWSKISVRLFDDVLPALKELKKEYKIGLISNTQSFAMEFFQRNRFFENFDAVCLSYDVGLLKPDPRIFRLALKKLGVSPSEAVMVGDNFNSDIIGAEAVGMNGVLIRRHEKMFGWNETAEHKYMISNLGELRKFL